MSSSPEWRQGQQRSGSLDEHEGDFKASDSQHPQLPEVFPSPHPAPTSTAGLLIVSPSLPSSAMALEQQQQQQDQEGCSNLQALAQAAAEEAEKQQEDGAEHLG